MRCLAWITVAVLWLAAGPSAAGTFKVGDKVAANVEEDRWYLATIGDRDGSKFEVRYGDELETTTLTPEKLRPLAAKGDLIAGDRVVAVWKQGSSRMYAGTVHSTSTTGLMVKWDDGSPSSVVKLGKIAQLEPRATASFALGAVVGAKYGSDWWIATVTGVKGDAYAVTYGDGTKGKVRGSDLRATAKPKDLTPGVRVLAVWAKDKKLYSGVIKARSGETFTVTWDDGSPPSAVLAKHIIKVSGGSASDEAPTPPRPEKRK